MWRQGAVGDCGMDLFDVRHGSGELLCGETAERLSLMQFHPL